MNSNNCFVDRNAYEMERDVLWDDDDGGEISVPYRNAPPRSSPTDQAWLSSQHENDYQRLHSEREDDIFNCNQFRGSQNIDQNTRESTNSAASSDDSTAEVLEGPSVLEKIEDFILQTVIEPLAEEPYPSLPEIDIQVDDIGFRRKLGFHHLSHARSLTSIVMVASFCYDLLSPLAVDESEEDEDSIDVIFQRQNDGRRHFPRRRTTTTREVYYFFVTHFRDQRECDRAIWDLVRILNLPSRQCLGLVASPKGWFCGSIDVYNAQTNELKFNGRELDSHGMAITPSTYDNPFHGNIVDARFNRPNSNQIRIESDARCILVIEKEGIYTRLSEDKFFLRYFPCILVTGKGFPDIATRRWVRRMQRTLKIPVYGFCDCNPFGVSVLDTYRHHQGVKLSTGGRNNELLGTEDEDAIEIEWLGLRPSQVETMGLPSEVFQELSSNDIKRLESLLKAEPATHKRTERQSDLKTMRKYKVELEALHWKGSDYISRFVFETVMKYETERESRGQKVTQPSQHRRVHFGLGDESDCESI